MVAERRGGMAGKRVQPPLFSDGTDFDEWEREIDIWSMVTDIPEEKQGAAIYLSLEGKARDCCKTIKVEELKGKTGKNTLMTKLRDLYAIAKEQSMYHDYEEFETYTRPSNVSITDFLNEWERRNEKLKKNKLDLPDGVLAYRLLKSANLEPDTQALVRATVTSLTLADMKKQIRAVFDHTAIDGLKGSFKAVKLEPKDVMYTSEAYEHGEDAEVYYSRGASNYSGHQYHRGRGGFRGRNRGGSSSIGQYRQKGTGSYTQRNRPSEEQRGKSRHMNPVSKRSGLPTRCGICDSLLHWSADCPHREEPIMFTKDIEIGTMNNFVHETLNHALLDSGCSKTVCGSKWYSHFVESLTSEQKNNIGFEKCSGSLFRFGDGRAVKSIQTVKIPVNVGNKKAKIVTDVVDVDIPLLLSKQSMKSAQTRIDFLNDSVSMFGEDVKLSFASTGHYMIPLFKEEDILLATKVTTEKEKNARKLHLQFGHASSHKIIQLLKDAGNKDEAFHKEVEKVVDECDICKVYHRNKNRPAVGFNLARDFNDVVSMDLKFIETHGILHLIDNATRFSSAAVIK